MTMLYSIPSQPEQSPLHERMVVVGLVVLLHALVLMAYWSQPERPFVMVNEISISFATMQRQQADVVPQPISKPLPIPKVHDAEQVPTAEPAAKETLQPASPVATPPSPVLLDTEPDYHAAYLNNPRPPYPSMAMRMGWQGKLLLDVEVFADGKVGEVKLLKSCNHEILDNAAIQTVKTWHFVPARRLGQAVTQWVQVPFRFNLEDKAL